MRSYPFNRPDAVIPQTTLPEDIRKDPHVLACFYFYVCIYMRGGIESLQVFKAMVRMWRKHPDLFDPLLAQRYTPEAVAVILKRFVGWDSKAASINWVHNSKQLSEAWGADPLNLLKGLRSYDEACRRMRNKRTKREQCAAGADGQGFRGFQYKMVSMLLYFYDWEGWLPRFIYPSPADFHNFRFAFASGSMEVRKLTGNWFTIGEKASKPWRDVVMDYLRARNVRPVEFSDALWLYSLVLCGNSPFTVTMSNRVKLRQASLFEPHQLDMSWRHDEWLITNKKAQILQTCAVCVFEKQCKFAVPARPYYQEGKFVLRPRPQLSTNIDPKLIKPPKPSQVLVEPEVSHVLSLS